MLTLFPESRRFGASRCADIVENHLGDGTRTQVGNTEVHRYKERHMMVCRNEAPMLRLFLAAVRGGESELGWYRENALVPFGIESFFCFPKN